MFLFTRLAAERRTVLVTLLVFSLSSGVVGGALFYIDSVGPSVFYDMTHDVGVDMIVDVQSSFYRQNTITLAEVRATIEQQSEVLHSEVVQIMEGHSEDFLWMPIVLGVNESLFSSFPEAIRLTDSWPIPKDNECYVNHNYMVAKGLDVGDTLNVTFLVYDYHDDLYYDQEVSLDLLIVGSFDSDLYTGVSFTDDSLQSQLFAVFSTQTFTKIMIEHALDYSFSLRHGIWLRFDHSRILSMDPVESITRLDNFQQRIEQLLLPYVAVFYNSYPLRDAMMEYVSWSVGVRLVAIGFSTPAIIMSILIVYYYSTLRADQQRRDTGTIKTRGASGRQAMFWILADGVLTAIIGGIAGLGVGIASAVLALDVKTFMEFDLSRLGQLSLSIQTVSVVIVLGFSLIVGVIVILPRAVQALTITEAAAHSQLRQEVLEQSENLGSPLPYLIAMLVSIQIITPVLFVSAYYVFFGSASIIGLGLVSVLIAVLTISIARLGAAPAARLKAALLGRVRRPTISPVARVLASSALLHKKTEAMSVIFVSMLFTTCVFASVAASTAHSHMCELIMFSVGGDLSVDVRPGLHNVTLDLQDDISSIDGIASVAAMLYTEAVVSYTTVTTTGQKRSISTPIAVFGVQPEEWLNSAFWLPYFTYYTTPEVALHRLSMNHSNVLASFKPVASYRLFFYSYVPVYSDSIRLHILGPSGYNVTDCTIVDTLTSLGPAGGQSYIPGLPAVESFVIVNLDYLHACLNSTEVSKFYIRLRPDANITRVMTEIHAIAPFSLSQISSSQILIEENINSRAAQTIHGIYTLNVSLSLLYLTVGMAAITIVKVRTLSRQFAVLRAVGCDSRSIINGMLIDIPITLLHAALLGAVPALLLAYLIARVPLMYMGLLTQMIWLRLPVTISVPVGLLAVILIPAVAVTLGIVYVVTRRSMRGAISEQIQFEE